MSTNAITGKGTIFSRWNGVAWVPLADIRNLGGPTSNRETVDVTTLDSSGSYREFIGSLRDAGDVSMTMNFTAASYALMKQDFESDTRQKYQIVLPDTASTTLEFFGLVTDLPLDIPVDDAVTCDITIKISGGTTLTNMFVVDSVEALTDITLTAATQLADAGLPEEVEVTFTDETTDDLAVLWNAGVPIFDGATNGEYVFTGTIVLGTDIINPAHVQVTQTVIIDIA